jgi:hypothetical protein
VRRGAAYPAERPSSYQARQQAVLRRQLAHRRAVMVAKCPRRCLHQHHLGGPRASAGPGGPGGVDAGRAFVSVSTSVQCPVQTSSLPACLSTLSTRLVSTVRCGRLSVRVSGVRCPLWLSGVGAFPRPLCPTGVRSWRAAVGQAAAWLDGRGRRARSLCPRPVRRNRGSRRRRPRWVRGGVGLDSAVVVGGGGGVARSTAWPTRIGRMRRGSPGW